MEERTYPGKIILFGEYTIIVGGKVLALPLNNITARWQKRNNTKNGDSDLLHYAEYLSKESNEYLHFSAFLEEIQDGLTLVSDIPRGYGAGSSGALVAAVFDRFQKEEKQYTTEELKNIFSCLESYFHGTSSGIDPLVSFMNRPVHIDKNKNIELVDKDLSVQLQSFYLVDSGRSKVTEKYVQIFRDNLQCNNYVKKLEELEILNTAIIDGLIGKISRKDLSAYMKNISLLQWDLFQPMIPPNIAKVWKKGLDTGRYCIKLCGSGGGGYFLGFSDEKNRIEKGWIPLIG
jgi:mevalonate kinase